ncbi:endonuclease III [Candidatus Cerribacteria bacterium 'Amazon FNV 2010 28 9']|uniref:Endonuclease III n=1 Tax=Candidatus Cerribacteria bacterium 'Amazon FNV 2010 28 9' TaxID=2081795 RepID=A0A317JUN0_9BACT|nr:MAG: endonuclease III [Candidatus Cerribacteria bacterium 'Amazon FNV 2010 28 9']
MPSQTEVEAVLNILNTTYPTLAMHEVHGGDPFRMLVAVILSQRSRDSVTVPLAAQLFEHIITAADLDRMPLEELTDRIRPSTFYQQKAKALKELAHILVTQYQGKVPQTEEQLLALPRVGRKTANIILTTFFNTPQIAVDTHVHRITYRLGWTHTKLSLLKRGRHRGSPQQDEMPTVEETERQLTTLIPKRFHSIVNRVFVAHGQTICFPKIPKCSTCPIEKYCQKRGVTTQQ